MGAINYYTSDYITMGIKPYEIDDFIFDQDFLEFAQDECGIDIENQEELEKFAYEEIQLYYNEDLENVKTILLEYSFWYYHVTIKSGYYKGFSINIENNFALAYDDYISKREANKEVTLLKQFLIKCADCGLVACFPGWGTGYKDYTGTLKEINAAVKEMREEIKIIPTWKQYERECE